mmetsp:Transcript_102710/g.203934  ORF Transcript_102710/g.203934 Transcript_102710/m.203934 type:complete len:80 (-) Transcript_102710:290-529(-)
MLAATGNACADGGAKKDVEPDFTSGPGDDTQPSSDGRAVAGAGTSFARDAEEEIAKVPSSRWCPRTGDGRRTGCLSMRL